MGVKIDKLTPEQKKYLASWEMGTQPNSECGVLNAGCERGFEALSIPHFFRL
jgi:hypothetical protein